MFIKSLKYSVVKYTNVLDIPLDTGTGPYRGHTFPRFSINSNQKHPKNESWKNES